MTWLDKLQRKYHKYGIDGITRLMVLANIIGYFLGYAEQFTKLPVISWISYDAGLILKGQIWRLISWIFVPTTGFSILSILFIICLLSFGDALERGLGAFRMTVYFLGGILLSDIVGLLIYLLFRIPIHLTTYHILFSLYMMLGLFNPEGEVRLYFILPIKMKWLVIVYFVMLAWDVITYFRMGLLYGLVLAPEILCAIINLLVFVSACKRRMSYREAAKQKVRREQYRRAASTGPNYGAGRQSSMHKCCICGRTEVTNPELTFRYCSRCSGAKEYCGEHLFTHTHS